MKTNQHPNRALVAALKRLQAETIVQLDASLHVLLSTAPSKENCENAFYHV